MNCIAVKMSEASGNKMMHATKKFPKIKEYLLIYKKSTIQINPVKIKKNEWDSEYNRFFMNFSKEEREIIKKIELKEQVTEEDINKVDDILAKVEDISIQEALEKFSKDMLAEDWLFENSYRIFRTASSSSVKKLTDSKKEENSNKFFSVLSNRDNKLYIAKATYSSESRAPRVQVLFADNYLEYTLGDIWLDISTTGLEFEGDVDFKNGKKPLKLIQRIISLFSDKDMIILDFFSGSATTAHAVIQANAEDGGNRRFIMVQLPENLDEALKVAKEENKKQILSSIDFLDSINLPHILTEIGEERIRRAGEKIKQELIEKQNKAGMLAENTVDPGSLDIGFKVLKLDTSNIREWNVDFENLESSLERHETPFIEGRTELDIVYEIMLKYGLELTYPIKTFEVDGKNVYDIAYGNLFICLANNIDINIAKAMIARRDEYGIETSSVVFSDAGFAGNDSEKLNCIELLKDAGYPEDNLLTI